MNCYLGSIAGTPLQYLLFLGNTTTIVSWWYGRVLEDWALGRLRLAGLSSSSRRSIRRAGEPLADGHPLLAHGLLIHFTPLYIWFIFGTALQEKTRPCKLWESSLGNIHIWKMFTLKNIHLINIHPWRIFTPEKYSLLKNIHPWKIFTPQKYSPRKYSPLKKIRL